MKRTQKKGERIVKAAKKKKIKICLLKDNNGLFCKNMN